MSAKSDSALPWLLLGGAGLFALAAVSPRGKAKSMSEAERIAALTPDTQLALRTLRAKLAAKGIKLYVGSTVRDRAGQDKHVQAGRSDADNSWHLVRRAFDVYVIDPKTGNRDTKGLLIDSYKSLAKEAAALGLRGIGFNADGSKRYLSSGAWDPFHFEFRGGMTWTKALAALPVDDRRARGLA